MFKDFKMRFGTKLPLIIITGALAYTVFYSVDWIKSYASYTCYEQINYTETANQIYDKLKVIKRNLSYQLSESDIQYIHSCRIFNSWDKSKSTVSYELVIDPRFNLSVINSDELNQTENEYLIDNFNSNIINKIEYSRVK